MTGATDTAGNVRSLERERRSRRRSTRAAQLMTECRALLRDRMQQALPSLLDAVDDALFELAEKADSNQLQSTYFEAMRSTRIRRESVVARFLSELDESIDRKAARAGTAEHRLEAPLTASASFSLVEHDDLEESVALQNLAAKIRNLCHDELFALDRRVSLLLSSPSAEGEHNPLGPETICNAAKGAVDALETTLEIRLLVLKLFDRQLSRMAEDAFAEINAHLVKRGVLPNVRADVSRPRPDATARTAGAVSSAPAVIEGGAQTPLGGGGAPALWQGSRTVAPGGGAGRPAVAAGGARGDEMLGVLDRVMRVDGAESANRDLDAAVAARVVGGLTALQRGGDAGHGNVLRGLAESGAAAGLGHADALMIDVVSMMFDYVLDDQNVCRAMRALIARLQIPVLKVAILDKTFFARRTHPARQLINKLAEFGARLDASSEEAALAPVEALVQRLLEDFELELDVFSDALAELETLLGSEEEAARASAWQSSKVAHERTRLQQARDHAESEVDARLDGVEVPESVAAFLRDHWRHLLASRLFREGEQGEGWLAAVQAMDNLLWSVAPKSSAADRERLLGMLPFLLESVRVGMNELCMAAPTRDAFLKSLSALHLEVVRSPEDARPTPAAGGAEVTCEAAPRDSAIGEREHHAPAAERRLREAVELANEIVFRTAAEKPQCQGMGTTVVALLLDGPRLHCAHVGDSRLYRWNGEALEQKTHDHTYRQEMLDRGLCDAEAAAEIASNLITRAVGADATVKVDVRSHPLAAGELWLACSDGLSDMLDDAAIAALLAAQETDLQSVAQSLIDAANAAGGRDNISVALLRVDQQPPAAQDAWSPDRARYFSFATCTDTGRRRSHNEDAVECDRSAGFVVLADGMGGHNAGEVASAMTVRVLLDALGDQSEEPAARRPDGDFDFGAINAVFWEEGVPGKNMDALHAAVAEEVESITLASDEDLDACFDIDGVDDPPLDSALEHVSHAAADPCLQRIMKLSCGAWVEFCGSSPTRARLTWIGPERSRYLFTDRLGQKVAESTPYGLAVEMRMGRLRLLESVPLFDRAVSSLTHRLRATPSESELH